MLITTLCSPSGGVVLEPEVHLRSVHITFIWLISFHLSWLHLISSDLISSEMSALWLATATAKWFVCWEATQLTVNASATSQSQHTQLRWSEVTWNEVRSGVRWVIRTLLRMLVIRVLQEARALTGHEDAVQCVVFEKTGDFLVSASSDLTARVWA